MGDGYFMLWKSPKAWLMASLCAHTMSFAAAPSNSNDNMTLLSSEKEPRALEKRVSALEKRRGGLLNPPARPLCEDYDFNFSGAVLFWQANEVIPTGVVNTATSFVTINDAVNLQDAKVKHIEFDYDPGFRLGIDFDTAYDGWDLGLTWTSLESKGSRDVSASGNKEIFATQANPQLATFLTGIPTSAFIYRQMRSHLKIHLNQLDLDLGREFFVSKHLTMRPHIGLRTTWIRQFLKVDYNPPVTSAFLSIVPAIDTSQKNKWWGIGIESGLDMLWMFGKGVSLYGTIAAAIESGFQKVIVKQSSEAGVIFEDERDSVRNSHPILDLQLGLRWDHGFKQDSYNFGLFGGWEHHTYFSQNQFHNELSPVGKYVANQGDLSYQGWTIGAHLAF